MCLYFLLAVSPLPKPQKCHGGGGIDLFILSPKPVVFQVADCRLTPRVFIRSSLHYTHGFASGCYSALCCAQLIWPSHLAGEEPVSEDDLLRWTGSERQQGVEQGNRIQGRKPDFIRRKCIIWCDWCNEQAKLLRIPVEAAHNTHTQTKAHAHSTLPFPGSPL